MKTIKRKINQTAVLIISALLLSLSIVIVFPQLSAAAPRSPNPPNSPYTSQPTDPATECKRNKCNLTKKYVKPLIAFLTAFAGIAITIGIVTGGIRYASAGDDPAKIGQAKKQIGTAITALAFLLFLYAGFRWLVPGL